MPFRSLKPGGCLPGLSGLWLGTFISLMGIRLSPVVQWSNSDPLSPLHGSLQRVLLSICLSALQAPTRGWECHCSSVTLPESLRKAYICFVSPEDRSSKPFAQYIPQCIGFLFLFMLRDLFSLDIWGQKLEHHEYSWLLNGMKHFGIDSAYFQMPNEKGAQIYHKCTVLTWAGTVPQFMGICLCEEVI